MAKISEKFKKGDLVRVKKSLVFGAVEQRWLDGILIILEYPEDPRPWYILYSLSTQREHCWYEHELELVCSK